MVQSVCIYSRLAVWHRGLSVLLPNNDKYFFFFITKHTHKKISINSTIQLRFQLNRPFSTCSTLQTIGTISSRFNFVYTVCRPPTKCLRNISNACGKQIRSLPSTQNEAISSCLYLNSLTSLFSGELRAIGAVQSYCI